MDADRTFNSCSWPMEEGAALKNACTRSDWTREEDKAFENALLNYYNDANMWDKIALAVPGKTIEDLKMHYEAFIDDVGLDVIDQKERPSPKHGVQTRGTPWTEEEHRQFLYSLQRFGKGDWKSISRYSVPTKSNSQVASHAQKFFKQLSSSKEGKRLSINDIRTLNPETLLALEKATKNCMPVRCKDKSTNAGRTEEPLPGCLEKASKHAENSLDARVNLQLILGSNECPDGPRELQLLMETDCCLDIPVELQEALGRNCCSNPPRKLQLLRGIICSLGTQREQEGKLGTNCFLLHLLLACLMAPDSLARRLELMLGTKFQSKQPDLFPPMHR